MSKLNVYLSNLAVGNIKLHNLHWNVTGLNFKAVHEYLEELYDDSFEKFDEVAEMQKMQGKKVLASIKSYLENASIEELDKEEYSVKEALELALDYLKTMKDLAMDIREEANQDDNFEITAMMESHISGYSKQVWFLENMLK